MRFIKPWLLALLVGLLVGSAPASEKYEIDPTHSSVVFTVRHMMVANVSGRFKDISGSIIYDQKDATKSSVSVTIKTVSIDTENENRDNHLRGPDFFDAANYPDITFVSKKIAKRKDGFTAVGDLTIRGVTKEVTLPFKILGTSKDSRGNVRLGVQAETKLNRFDYGVKWDQKMDDGGLVVGEEVALNLAVEAIARAQ